MDYRTVRVQQLQTNRCLGFGIRFFLTAALSASHTAGGYAPFALGCIAASGGGANAAAALAGGLVGAMLFLDFSPALSFCACAVLIVTAATTFQGVAFLDRPWVMPVTAGGAVMAVGGIYVLQSLSPAQALPPCAAAAILTGVSAHFLGRLLRRTQDTLAPEGLLFLGAALTMALGDLTVGGISVGRALLCALLLDAAHTQGPLTGAAAGLGLGLLSDLCVGTGGLFTAAYGAAGLCAARPGRRCFAAAAFFAGALAAMLTSREALAVSLLLEAAAGAVVFLLLPRRFFAKKQAQPAAAALEQTVKRRLAQAAEALRSLHESILRTPAPREENPAVVFDRASERVCRSCALCGLCWQREYTSTFNALNDATARLLEQGRCHGRDFPEYFSNRCIHLSEFLQAVNTELSAYLLRRQYRRQLDETRRTAKGQYAQLSELLTAAAAGLTAQSPCQGHPCTFGAALRPKEGQSVCGDTVEVFQTGGGTWCLLLSDGMGSGEEARRESSLTCRLLRQFLEADIQPEAALTTLNSAMALRGAETGSFTTADLCVIDGSGDTLTFYKFGAAPSYLKKTAPCGASAAPACRWGCGAAQRCRTSPPSPSIRAALR